MRTDAELVAAFGDSDVSAIGDVFSRYGDRLHDYCWSILRSPHDAWDAVQDSFLLAAERIDGLRDPNKLRPWLFAIARNECLRRMRDKSTPTDDFTHLAVEETSSRAVEQDELTTLVQEAAAGLDARDRAVLDLQLRHGLEGEELAEALGVKPAHAHVLVGRVRGRVERSLTSLLVARRGRRDCADLAKLLKSWDGSLSPLLRKRVSRHIDACSVCERTKAAVASPLALLAAAPLVVAPSQFRAQLISNVSDVCYRGVKPGVGKEQYTGMPSEGPGSVRSQRYSWGPDGFPMEMTANASKAAVWWIAGVAAVVLAALGVGIGASVVGGDGDRVSTAAVATALPLVSIPPSSGTPIVLAPTSAVLSTTAPPPTTSVPPPPATSVPPSTTSTSTTSTSTTSTSTTSTTTTSTSSTTTTAPPDLEGPVIADVETTSNTIVQDGGPGCLLTTAMVSATITDAGSGVDVLELEITAFGRTQTLSLRAVESDDPDLPPPPDRFEGQVGPFRSTPPESGSAGIVATLKAVDLSGNETTSSVIIKFLGCN